MERVGVRASAVVAAVFLTGCPTPPQPGGPDLAPEDQWVPDLSLADLSMPDLRVPDLSTPDLWVPDLSMPDLSMPDLSVPDLSMPDLSVPDLSTPDLSARDLAMVDGPMSMPDQLDGGGGLLCTKPADCATNGQPMVCCVDQNGTFCSFQFMAKQLCFSGFEVCTSVSDCPLLPDPPLCCPTGPSGLFPGVRFCYYQGPYSGCLTNYFCKNDQDCVLKYNLPSHCVNLACVID
jgi:hypothetical protein